MTWWAGVGYIPVLIREMKIKGWIFIVSASIIVAIIDACSPGNLEPDSSRLGLEYFPLETGNYRVYEVKEITYNTQGKDTFNYFIREKVLEPFENAEGGISYKIERSSRSSINDPWQQDSIWTARRDAQKAVVVENNIPLVKLVFPLREEKTWNGNVLTDREPDEYTMVNLRWAYDDSVENVYDKTVTVIQEENRDPVVQTNLRREVYAEYIGMIYKESIILNFCTVVGNCEIGDITTGRDFRMRLIEHGME